MRKCKCTREELAQLAALARENPETLAPFFALYADEVTWPEGAEGIHPHDVLNAEEVKKDIDHFGSVCETVLEARRWGDARAEDEALGGGHRWGRRGQGETALSYVVEHFRHTLGQDVFQRLSGKAWRTVRYVPGKGGQPGKFEKSFNPSRMAAKRFR